MRVSIVVFGVLVGLIGAGLGGLATGAVASPVLSVSSVSFVGADRACSSKTDAGDCDADDDRIPDAVEREVCGTLTCGTGLEDVDGDGVPDWTEVLSCGSVSCASATKDRDGDGIPDFAERLVCGSDTCSNSLEDEDGDRIGDWVEFVICGDRTCATGAEDYDGNGIADADELAACVKRVDDLASTGFWLGWLAVAAAVAMAAGIVLQLRRQGLANPEALLATADFDDELRDNESDAVGAIAGVSRVNGDRA